MTTEALTIPFAEWSRAFAEANAPTPKLGEMAEAAREAAKRIEGCASSSGHLYGGDVLNGDEMRTAACLWATADLLDRIKADIPTWPERCQDVVRGHPKDHRRAS